MADGRATGAAPERARARKDDAVTLQIVTFPVGGEEFGIDITAVTEAIRPLPITALPHMPPFIEGVINLRGRIIPIVDLRKRFNLADSRIDRRKTRMIIIRGATTGRERDLLGLMVDGVRDVMPVFKGQIERAPAAATGRGAEFIAGVAKTKDGLVILLDVARILSRAERAALAEADHVHP